MAEYVNIRIRKDTYERLKELSAGVPLVRFLDDACRHWSNNNKVPPESRRCCRKDAPEGSSPSPDPDEMRSE